MQSGRDRPGAGGARLARTVRTTLATAVASASRHVEHHPHVNWLRDVILGGQDGLVNILGIILGVIAGGGSKTVLLAAGFAPELSRCASCGETEHLGAFSPSAGRYATPAVRRWPRRAAAPRSSACPRHHNTTSAEPSPPRCSRSLERQSRSKRLRPGG